VERYLITSAVNGVLAQRLVRTLCIHCKQPHEVGRDYIVQTGLRRFVPEDACQLFRAAGCPACNHTGYAGRTGIHELFVLDNDMHREIMSGADATLLHAAARRQGMVTLYEDGLRKVVAGVTSMEELLRVTQDQSEAGASPEAVLVDIEPVELPVIDSASV
jgi:general secretion pathway protein E